MNINQLFQDFNQQTIWVLGDVMVDSYYYGTTDRISPEAPVPIVDLIKKEHRLGGAGNVALNLLSLGAKPILLGIRGNDKEGDLLLSLLSESGLSSEGIITDYNRSTTSKTRILSNGHQVLRIDEEQKNDINAEIKSKFDQLFNQLEKPEAVILQDYNKGVLSEAMIESIINYCRRNSIPTVVDPKKKNFLAYKGCTLFKPNRKEITEGLNLEYSIESSGQAKEAINLLNKSINASKVMVTMSEQGAVLSTNDKFLKSPAHSRRIVDVSGAGDSVVSVASLCVALNTSDEILLELSNLAGGLVCEKLGVVPIDKNALQREALELF
jgi:rfaE bifunctional protein kinase chain/domain